MLQAAHYIAQEGGHRTEGLASERAVLRWHFAIATFDSAATALHVYKECDATELPNSCAPLDLRLVPEAVQFTHFQVCKHLHEQELFPMRMQWPEGKVGALVVGYVMGHFVR